MSHPTTDTPSDRLPSGYERHTFAVYPVDFDGAFEAFLMDVPGASLDAAARRAYFSAMAVMASRGFDVDAFSVAVFDGNRPGPLVGPGGVLR